MARGASSGATVDFLRDNFKKVSCMDMGYMCGRTAESTKGFTSSIKSMEKALISTQMGVGTVDSGPTVCSMDSVAS